MKKYIILLSFIIFLSCSSNDNGSESNNFFNPPNWIKGIWLNPESSGVDLGFEFTNDDFCDITGNITNCFGSSIEQSNGLNQVDEEINNTDYIIEISINNGALVTNYHFRKISSTEIEYIQSGGFNTRYIKQ